MRVLITGGSGFLGRNMALRVDPSWDVSATYLHSPDFAEWAAKRTSVKPVRCDLTDEQSLRSGLGPDRRFDVVLHLAARVDIPGSLSDPGEDLAHNALSTLNLVRNVSARHLIVLSSGAVYEGQSGPVDHRTPLTPSLPYASHKLLSELYARAAVERYEAAQWVTVVRFFGAYGPYEPERKIYTRLVRELGIERRRTFDIYGDGTNLIDAMWIDDACDGLTVMASGEEIPTESVQTVDFARGEPMHINALVSRAAAAFGLDQPVIQHHGTAHESNLFRADPADLERRLGVRATTSLEEGLQRFASSIARLDA